MVAGNEQPFNHRLYREVNKRIGEVLTPASGAVELLCECGRADCTETIELSNAQIDSLLSDGKSVLLAAGHADGRDGHRVLAKGDRFFVVAAD